MNRWAAAPLLALALAVAPASLLVGVARDQAGLPIVGARVSLGSQTVVTDVNGTFAFSGSAGGVVTISCDYCRTTRMNIAENAPLVAIVRRYDALNSDGPSERDLASLPYAHVESVLSLQPFVVLEDSKSPLPGPKLSLFGATPSGLIIDDGFANYDISAGISTLPVIPSYSVKSVDVRFPADSPGYGDLAGNGIFVTDTQPDDGTVVTAISGSENAVSIGRATAGSSINFATSSDPTDRRDRFDATIQRPLGNDASLLASAISGSDTSQNFSAMRLRYERNADADLFVEAFADNAGYGSHAISASSLIAGRWFDAGITAGFSSKTVVQTFADASVRTSSGFYSADPFDIYIAGHVAQTHLDLGARSSGARYSWSAALGGGTANYTGGSEGYAEPMNGQFLTPSLNARYDITSAFTLSAAAWESYYLPSLLRTYSNDYFTLGYREDFPGDISLNSYPPDPSQSALLLDRAVAESETLAYSDRRRIKIALTAIDETMNGLDKGSLQALGASFAWQIAPSISLRSWALRTNDRTYQTRATLRLSAYPRPATVGSVWMTYDAILGLRADAIYRSDLIDYAPDRHFDFSLSGPLGGSLSGSNAGLRWFLSSERRQGKRYAGAGLRFEAP